MLVFAHRSNGQQSAIYSRIALIAGLFFVASSVVRAEEKSLAELIPRIPPKSISEAQKSFRLQHGFGLELVASEPEVVDPIDMAFDEYGRMYVVEMNDYPFLPEQRVQKYRDQRSETWGRIRQLTDTDGDGRFDKSVLFADRLRWPQSVCCSMGGVFVVATPNLYFMKDTDNDGVADHQEIICSGFGSSNVQGLSNGMEWGRDNAIYFASGMAGGKLTVHAREGRPEYQLTPGSRDLRLDPKSFQITMVAGGQQYGHTIDDWGDRFICSNSNHVVHVTWPLNYLERNPSLAVSDLTRAIAKEGAAAVVFRSSPAEPWRIVRTARRAADPEMKKRLPPTELVPVGFFTSATGVTVYRGGVYPPDFQGNVFVGDCGSNLVHRKTLTPQGISFVAERADEGVEFLSSTDNWFRPVNFVNAPDGTLYVIDMYRETIEHPVSIPDDIKALVDLESGYDKGRIWRLAPPGYRRIPPPDLGAATSSELVEHLKSPHGWIRDTAQRLIVERMDLSVVDRLRGIARENPSAKNATTPQTRLHALWSLHGMGVLNEEDILAALKDSNVHLREVGLRVLSQRDQKSTEVQTAAISLSSDPSLRVRWQLAFTLGELSPQFSTPGLKAMAVEAAGDPDVRIAWFSSIATQMSSIATELIRDDNTQTKPVLMELARLIGSAPKAEESVQLLELITQDSISDSTRIPILVELGEGLRRRGSTLAGVISGSKSSSSVSEAIAKCCDRAAKVVMASDAREPDRILAIRVLGYGDAKSALTVLPELFAPQTPVELQNTAIRSLALQGTDDAYGRILEPWKSFGPNTRREIVDQLVQSANGAKVLLTAVEKSSIKPTEIDRDQRQLLLNHPQTSVRDAAKIVLAEPPSNRKQVVDNYQTALELKGDAARGRMLFGKTCVQCHRVGTTGHQVGPDIASAQNKSEADLLIAILDPNREALPKYQTYTAVTIQGKVYAGIISSETSASLTLKRAEAKEDVILRETVDELRSNGVSLMPEGLEKDLDQQQIADIIAAIKSGM